MHEPSRPLTDGVHPLDPPRSSPRTGFDAEDLAATAPAMGWDQAQTVPASAPLPGSGPSADETLVVQLNRQLESETVPTEPASNRIDQDATLVDPQMAAAAVAARREHAAANLAETVPTAIGTSAEAQTLISTPTPVPAPAPGSGSRAATRPGTGSFSQTASGALSGSYTRTGTRLGRTRINNHLQLTDQQLDERLQLSRSSVLTDMTVARGPQAVPKGLQKLVTDQGTDARYHINRPLAAGGMGAVLDIQDNDFRRGAAMKVMHGRFTNDPQALERFLAEAQVTAQLEHPNIVPIHDMGVMPDGSLYFTMKLIEGLSLGDVVKLQRIHTGLLTRDEYLAEKAKKEATKSPDLRKSSEQLAADYAADVIKGAEIAARFTQEATLLMFLKVLDGVGFAHSRGVVHRDIKPDNIMLGAHGEVLVVDWGIAKVLKKADRESEFVRKIEREVVSLRDEQAISATVTGSAMGTLFYMPPEQACGDLERLNGRSDIYALGATLYELLALRRCFEAKSLAEALAIITTGDWVPLDRALPTLSKDLVAIVHRAMALDPGRRYGDCGQFADDIRRYLAGQAVLARQRNVIELIGAWVAAHKRQVQVGAGGLALIVATITGTTSYLHHAMVQAGNAKLGEAQVRYVAAQKSDALEDYQEAKQILATASGFITNDGRISELREAINLSIKDAQRRQDEERKRQAAQISAKLSYDEALKLCAEERYEDAESNINAALRIDPLNADFLKTRDEVRRLLNDRRLRQRAQRARELRAQADAALLTAGQLTLDDAQVVVLLDTAKTAFDQLEALSEAGTQDQIQRYTALRVGAEQARNHKRLAAEAVPLKKAVREALTAAQYEAARAALEQARGKTPEDKDLVLLNDELVSAETRYHDQQAVLKARKDADQALEMAGGFEKSGKLDEALARIDVALTFVPNDGKALALREQVLVKKRQAELQARRTAAIASAEAAMTEAAQEQKLSSEAGQQVTAATVRIADLDRQLGRAPIAQKSPLFRAIAEQKAARTAMAEHWALAEGKANSAVAALAEFPGEAKANEVRKLLCQLYLARLKEARKTRSLSEINAFSNLIRRFDPDGSFKRELDNQGQLTVTGTPSAAVVARVLEEGPDTRLVPLGDPVPVTVGTAVTLPVGSYLVTSGAQSMTVLISGGQNRTLAWPGALPAIPGVPLSYVPAQGEQKPFLLGTTEVTVAQYLEFLRSPEIFATLVERYHKSYESGKPLPFPHMPAAMVGDEAFVPLFFELGHAPADESRLGAIRLIPGIDAKLPMGKVTRPDAEAYCAWLSQSTKLKVRLPKLKEWQFAAHGGDDRRVYPWGPYFVGQFAATALSIEQDQQAVKVGSFPTDCGPFGHLDLAGNVREWLGDNDQDGPLAAGANGALIAGGSYSSDNPLTFTTSFSESVEPDSAYLPIGFRILVELP
jgi:serine/threonine protein kinase/formylglycine-generating enzyme required for sulfatase activity